MPWVDVCVLPGFNRNFSRDLTVVDPDRGLPPAAWAPARDGDMMPDPPRAPGAADGGGEGARAGRGGEAAGRLPPPMPPPPPSMPPLVLVQDPGACLHGVHIAKKQQRECVRSACDKRGRDGGGRGHDVGPAAGPW
jgi:hypothetical protein